MDPARPSRARLLWRAAVRTVTVLLVIAIVVPVTWFTWLAIRDRDQTGRATAEFQPPVWAGQDVPGACSGGFYARHGEAIVLTIVAHCAEPGNTLRDPGGAVIGVYGPRAELADCPPGRFCAPSDILALELEDAWIPWGHLNLVDMGAGGYRTIQPGTKPLACSDIRVGDRVELDGREHFRTGTVSSVGRYEFGTDTIFPCMVVVDGIEAVIGDSGGAVLVNGLPAGIISRSISGKLGFTPLAEGLENLGLVLCTTPNCD